MTANPEPRGAGYKCNWGNASIKMSRILITPFHYGTENYHDDDDEWIAQKIISRSKFIRFGNTAIEYNTITHDDSV